MRRLPAIWLALAAIVAIIVATTTIDINPQSTDNQEESASDQEVRIITSIDCDTAFNQIKSARNKIDRLSKLKVSSADDDLRNKYLEAVEIAGSQQCLDMIGKTFFVSDEDLAQFSEVSRIYYLYNLAPALAPLPGHIADNQTLPLNPEH